MTTVISTVRISTACTACGMCLATCPTGALLAAPRRPWVMDQRCTSCGACIEICPTDAISEIDICGHLSTEAGKFEMVEHREAGRQHL